MDHAFIALGAAFVAWGTVALWATWTPPDLATRAFIRPVLLPGRIAPTRRTRTLASSVPVVFGMYLIAASIAPDGPRWPSVLFLVLFLVASVALHLMRSDG
ncbi:hypothetical protein [Lysobacter sp. A3-1-A15]|uniref:hypothetical protein n=1 Tax=Novilysobacter viscosus TaxID=3098602 RepID=UPI002ED79E95